MWLSQGELICLWLQPQKPPAAAKKLCLAPKSLVHSYMKSDCRCQGFGRLANSEAVGRLGGEQLFVVAVFSPLLGRPACLSAGIESWPTTERRNC